MERAFISLYYLYYYYLLWLWSSHLNALQPKPGSFSVENGPHYKHRLSKWVFKTGVHM